jgi:predicted RND superfamily exporter protein
MGAPTKWPLRRVAWSTIGIFLVLLATLGWQARKFAIDASAETLLVKDDRNYLLSQQASQRYEPEEFILVAFKPSNFGIFDEKTRDIIKKLSSDIEQIDRVKSVRSLLNMPIFIGIDAISADIEPDQLTWEARGLNSLEMEKILADHPLYEGLLVNQQQTALAMQVTFDTSEEAANLRNQIIDIESHMLDRELTAEEESELAQLKKQQEKINKSLDEKRSAEIEQIRQLVSRYDSEGEFYLGGNNLLAHQLIEIIRSDLVVFGAAIVIVVALVLFLLFRRWHWVLVPLVVCAASVVMTLGLLGLFGLKVTVISANVVALQIILTLAVIVHLIVQYQELVTAGTAQDQESLAWETVKRKFKPCFYASLTTAIGFGSLIFSGVQPVISFGWMMVLAMVVTLITSLVLFPALLIALVPYSGKVKQHPRIQTLMSWCATSVRRHQTGIVALSATILIAGIVGCFRLSAENSFLNYFSDSTDVYRELTFIDQEFGGSTPLDLLYRIPEEQTKPDLIITADAIQTLQSIQNALEEHKAIGNITSVVDFARIARVVTGKPLVEYELTALYHTLEKDLRADLFSNYFSVEDGEVRISMRIQDATEGLDRAELMESIHRDMAELGIAEKDYQLTNLFVLYQDILARLVNSQFVTLAIVYAAMTLMLLLIFRSLPIALICLVPNLVTTAAIMGGMGLAGIPLDLMTITIAAVAMGISVDDTIHYVHRYRESAGNATDAVRDSMLSVGYAMVYTTLIIVIGFSSLIFSEFVPSILFGVLTGITMLVALLMDLTILPVLLQRFIKPSAAQKAEQSGTFLKE